MIRDVFLTYFGGSLSRETAKIYYIYIYIYQYVCRLIDGHSGHMFIS
jgi:hypothetical protein